MSITKGRIIGLGVVLGLAVLGGLRIRQVYEKTSIPKAGGKKGGAANARVVTVSVGEASKGSVDEEIMITGALKPKEQVDVSPKVGGRLERLTLHVGDNVKRGDLIAVLEDEELQQQVKRAAASRGVSQASLAQRDAELLNAAAELARSEKLFSEGLIARQDLEARRTGHIVIKSQVELSRAQVQQSEAELKELTIRLDQTRIFAPMDGFISKRHVDVGALVTPSNPIVTLVNISTMVTAANLPEREVAKLRVGNRALVRVDAFGEKRFDGRVVRVSPVLDAATRSALVEIEIPNPDNGLKAEMFVRVTLDLASKRDAVLIPREALVYRGSQAGVYVLAESRQPNFRMIETGSVQGEQVEVLSNLSPGTKIITRGASMLGEGDQIRISDQLEEPSRRGGAPPS